MTDAPGAGDSVEVNSESERAGGWPITAGIAERSRLLSDTGTTRSF